MKFLFCLLLNVIIAINACFIFQNGSRNHCAKGLSPYCFIPNPAAKIERNYCGQNSEYSLEMKVMTVDDLETLFFHNAETVEKLVNILHNSTNASLKIKVFNASSPSRADFRFDDEWLTSLLNRFQPYRFTIHLSMTIDHFPPVIWTKPNITALVGARREMTIIFFTEKKMCMETITRFIFDNNLFDCYEKSVLERLIATQRKCDALIKLEYFFSVLLVETPSR